MRTKIYSADSTLSIHILELIGFRVAQINLCEYCMAMHHKELKYLGDTEVRLSSVSNWKYSSFFSNEEKGLLALTDHLAQLNNHQPSGHIFPLLLPYFCLDEIDRLSFAIKQISNWTLVMKNF